MEVLIADDSNFMVKVLKNMLETLEPEEVYTAADGDEAIETYREERPDIVLLDIVMDNVDGIEALEEIKEIDQDAKVIMISAVGQKQTAEEAMEKGAEDFIEKPFENKEVREKIKSIVEL